MVEPAASIIFNTLSHHPHPIYSVSRVMSRPGRLSLTPGFFNPQPRRVKGKEPDVLSVYSARCQEWSCRMRISLWCSSGAENADTEEKHQRPRAVRRARKVGYTVPRHFPSDRILPPAVLRRGQTRHASHTSDPPFPDSDPPSSNAEPSNLDAPTEASAVSDTESLVSTDAPAEDLGLPPEAADASGPPLLDDISETDSPPSIPLHPAETEEALSSPAEESQGSHDVEYLQTLMAEKGFQLEKSWHAFEVIQTRGGLSTLTATELSTLAQKLLDSVEARNQLDDLDELHKWGGRVWQVLEALAPAPSDIPARTLQNLRARALALEGDLQKALNIIHSEIPIYEHFGPFLRVYESLLVSIWRHHDRLRALEFLVLEWKIIGGYLLTETSRPHIGSIGASGASLRETAFAIVSGISLPALVLADKQNEWEERDRKHMGELLIEALFRAKIPTESVEVLREMRRQGLKPTQYLPLHLVRALARDDLYHDAHTLYASIDEQESYDYLFTGLYLHANEGHEKEAHEYFDRITEAGWMNSKDVLQLMYAYAVQGRAQKTLEIFQEFFPADENGVPTNSPLVEHFAVGAFAHAQRGDFSGIQPWIETMRVLGIQPEAYIFTTILKSFALRGDLSPMSVVLNQMRAAGHPPNLVTYTTVMTLLAHRKDPASTEAMYMHAVKDGIVPDSIMIATLMNAHIEAGSWKGVIRAFDFVKSSPRIQLTIGIYNLLLKAYIQIGAPFRVVSRIFNRLERLRVRPDAYTFALLIQSACDSRQMNTASDIFTEMEKLAEKWGSSRHITTWTLTIIMVGFLRRGDNERAMAVYADMVRRDLKPSAVTYGVIISAYGREGTEESFQLAEKFIKDLTSMPEEERIWETPSHGRLSARDHLYLPLMQAYSSRHKPQEVDRLLGEMIEDGGEPTLSILSTVLDAYVRVGDIEGVLRVWPQIFQLGVQYSTIPLFEEESDAQKSTKMHTFVLCLPLSRYISALSKADLHDEIASVWKSFQTHGFSFSADNWNQLAKALLRAGEVERCFEILERVLVPYHRRSNRLRQEERDSKPDSPLSLDVAPADQRPLEKPLVGKARSEATKWARFHRRAKDQWNNPQYVDDLAYHLYVLHRVSPMWNTWQPRADVLHGLLEVLLRLRAGYPVDASTPDTDESTLTHEEVGERTREAMTRLRTIYNSYPDAVVAVEGFERRERRRLGRWFTKVYSWASPG
ncbi:hypothetical protein DFH07DRAFT_960464 [Mycena maculata]|uniref:Pentatricopeptide repeat protein n=1 Tax=Mycena maculata TaxID=230809 RepID=A0AAD7J231_9AGAR|nr:hypothetical protein DFH07DRAFT_960464 [Mycena maculata]